VSPFFVDQRQIGVWINATSVKQKRFGGLFIRGYFFEQTANTNSISIARYLVRRFPYVIRLPYCPVRKSSARNIAPLAVGIRFTIAVRSVRYVVFSGKLFVTPTRQQFYNHDADIRTLVGFVPARVFVFSFYERSKYTFSFIPGTNTNSVAVVKMLQCRYGIVVRRRRDKYRRFENTCRAITEA